MNRGKTGVGDVVEVGHARVGEDPQAFPPPSSGGMPLEGVRRRVPLHITSRETLV